MIRIYKSKKANCYMVDFSESKQAMEIFDIFQTYQIPSPFTLSAKPGDVLVAIKAKQTEPVFYDSQA